jgi:hypothetical protein
MLSIRDLFSAALLALVSRTRSGQGNTGTRSRGSRHPRRFPIGHQAKRRRLRRLQKAARRVNR